MTTASNEDLALARAYAAERLDETIAGAGRALAAFMHATRALELRANVVELERYVQNAIVLHLTKAGFGEFLDRKLAGAAPSLRRLVEQQHRRLGIGAENAQTSHRGED